MENETPIDVFGESVPVETPAPVKEVAKEVKGDDKALEDVKNHPFVKELQGKLDGYGNNLSGQGKVIDKLTKEIEALKAGKSDIKTEAGDSLFKDVKTSKDLTQAEKDEMTESEVKTYDEIAMLKQTLNKLAENNNKKEDATIDMKVDATIDMEVVDDLNSEAKAMAIETAGGDIELANKIIAEFNQFAGNETLTKTQLTERMAKSAKLVDGYKAPKEQATRRGSVVNGGAGNNKDPFGVDSIVAEATTPKAGNYKL